MITIAKGRELAERLGTRYCESSAETGDGVHSVIDTAVRLAVMNQNPSKTKFKIFQWQRKTPKMLRHGPEPPVLSPPGVYLETSLTILLLSFIPFGTKLTWSMSVTQGSPENFRTQQFSLVAGAYLEHSQIKFLSLTPDCWI